MERNIIHIRIDSFFIEVERILEPFLRKRPVIIAKGENGGGGYVMAASQEAYSCGVRPAMPLELAKHLAPDAAVIPPRFSLYRRASAALMNFFESYSPVVEVDMDGEAYMDMTGTERLMGKPREVSARMIKEISKRFGFPVIAAGVASNKVVAKIASRIVRFSGIVDVAHGYEADMIAPLPVRYLPSVGPRMCKRLKEMGVELIGTLASMPQDYLTISFGKAGLVLHRRARGIDSTPVTSGKKKVVLSSGEIMAMSADPHVLGSLLFLNVERLCKSLRFSGGFARRIELSVVYADFVMANRSCILPEPSDMEFEVFPVVEDLLKHFLERRVLIRSMNINLFVVKEGYELPLFVKEKNKRLRRLLSAIDSLRMHYGEESLIWGRVAWKVMKERYLCHSEI